MAVSIRLRRAGRKGRPFYHVVAVDSRKPRDGRYIERLGYYDPTRQPAEVKLDLERYRYWLGVGARASRTVSQLAARSTGSDGQQGS